MTDVSQLDPAAARDQLEVLEDEERAWLEGCLRE
jgi:hypothetical protein